MGKCLGAAALLVLTFLLPGCSGSVSDNATSAGTPIAHLASTALPVRANGTVVLKGETTASGGHQTDSSSPNMLDYLALAARLRVDGVMYEVDIYLIINGRTKMFDVSGVKVPRSEQFQYEGTEGIRFWRAVARRTDQGWVALELYALSTLDD